MKQLLLALFFCSTFLMSSCSKDRPPELEVIVTTKASDRFESASFWISSIDFFEIDSSTNQVGVSNLQDWSRAELEMELDSDQSFVLANDGHSAADLVGMKLSLLNLAVTFKTGHRSRAEIPFVDFVPLTETVKLENNKRYSIEFIIDFDKLTSAGFWVLSYAHDYEVIITEL